MAELETRYNRLRWYVGELKSEWPESMWMGGEAPASVLEAAHAVALRIHEECLACGRHWVDERRRSYGQQDSEKQVVPVNRLGHRRTTSSTSSATLVDAPGGAAAAAAAGGVSRYDESMCRIIRKWKSSVESLAAAYRWSFVTMYCEHDRSPGQHGRGDVFLNEQIGRKSKGELAMAAKRSSRELHDVEDRLRNYQKLADCLDEIRGLLRAAEQLTRRLRTFVIAPRGDAILQFSNLAAPELQDVLRFRVSSHMLAETSPYFQWLFSADGESSAGVSGRRDADMTSRPVSETTVFADGGQATLYHMPQLEINQDSALSILLHAAHVHTDQIPREVTFAQFVAIAEAALRYRCTAPLELVVEHRWLPQWMQKAFEPMADGLLLISYVFGPRWLFTRMTKTAIMNLVDERELAGKRWPQHVKDRIWAVRCAKTAQLLNCVAELVQEYLPRRLPPAVESVAEPSPDTRPHSESIAEIGAVAEGEDGWDDNVPATSTSVVLNGERRESTAPAAQRYSILSTAISTISGVSGGNSAAGPPTTSSSNVTAKATANPASPLGATSPKRSLERLSLPLQPSNTPRCPKGSHWCDATNLGWLLLMLGELRLLGTAIQPDGTLAGGGSSSSSFPSSSMLQPARSLADLSDELRSVPSPPHPVHPPVGAQVSSVCDFAPVLRKAVNDVYNSVTGLALHEVAEDRYGLARGDTDWRSLRMNETAAADSEEDEAAADDEPDTAAAGVVAADGDGLPPGDDEVPDTRHRSFFDVDDSTAGAPTEATNTEDEGADDPPSSSAFSTSTTAELASSSYGDEAGGTQDAEMTVEEAQRVLWPDQSANEESHVAVPDPLAPRITCWAPWTSSSSQPEAGSGEAVQIEVQVREKFLSRDVSGVEDKMLVVTTQKQLRVDYERRVGLANAI